MVVKRVGRGYGYDFRLLGKRHRKARFRSKAEAAAAEKLKREELLSGKRKVTMQQAYDAYLAATKMQPTTREDYERFWDRDIKRHVAHLFVEEVRSEAIGAVRTGLPDTLGPKSINQRLILLRAVLRFAWDQEWLAYPPKVKMEKVPRRHVDTYSAEESGKLLDGFFRLRPQWYLFYYLTARLGPRVGEVYALEHDDFRRDALQVVFSKTAQRGSKDRPVTVKPARKGGDTMALDVTQDIIDAYDWHCQRGYAGRTLVFAPTDRLPKHLDSHKIPLAFVQQACGLRKVSHHRLGRHSVATLASEAGASLKAIQAQLGHASPHSTLRYMHAAKGEQRRIVERSRPEKAPHERELN